jgi:hypothetical protein
VPQADDPRACRPSARDGLDVRFLAAGGPIDFRRDHVDLAIRRNDFPIEADLFSVELADEWMGPVTAPTTPVSPDAPPALLHSTSRPTAWRDWQKRSGIKPDRASAISYEHFYLSIQAQKAAGQAMASVHMVARELAEDALWHLTVLYGTERNISPSPRPTCAGSPQTRDHRLADRAHAGKPGLPCRRLRLV